MASNDENIVKRSLSGVYRLFGVTSSADISDQGVKTPKETTTYGAFTVDELRHMSGIGKRSLESKTADGRPIPREETIGSYLESVSDNTHSKIEELRNLVCVAPEIKVAKRVIVSTIMSPTSLQTNKINITMNYEGVSQDIRNKILDMLNDHFNNEVHLAPKLAEWLGCAGFEEGAKAIMILPKHELDVQNAIADALSSNEDLRCAVKSIEASTEDLCPDFSGSVSFSNAQKNKHDLLENQLEVEAEIALENLGSEKFFTEHKDKPFIDKSMEGKEIKISNTHDLAGALTKGTFKLLRQNGDGTVLVTRDLSHIQKGAKTRSVAISQLLRDAKMQMTGFNPSDPTQSAFSSIRSYSISDTIKLADNDLPIVIEFPSESVIPVCAPRDHKNHIGYFVLLDETGQPISGKNNYFKTGSTDVTNRLAMGAAKGIYGNATLSSFSELANSPEMVLKQMTDVFSVAVNKLLESKLTDEGLSGLDINVHNAVGKALFMNLLAKNKIRMVFVPEPMMVYYRFDHREDGTGKTFLEDVGQMLALRTTLMVAKLMATIDNATMHRRIEVDVDEKDNNPIQTIQMVVRQALSKYAPAFSTEIQTAAESLINRNISVVPKSIAGTTDNLSVSIDKSYGNSQPPDSDMMDKLNNWIAMSLGGIPASVLNQLGENEFARSVATTNMYFGNTVAEWQNTIKPHNKKYVVNYVSANARILKKIEELLTQDKKGEPQGNDKNKSDDTVNDKIRRQIADIVQSLDVDLPAPEMAVKKAHFEEVTAFAEMCNKIIGDIFSDDIVVDEELKGQMQTIRAAILSKTLREFMPKLGCTPIADIPEPDKISADYAKDIALYLLNLKRHIKNLTDAAKGTLPKNAKESLERAPGEENTEETSEFQ